MPISPDLRKVHESGSEIRFEHPHARAWPGAVIGIALIAAAFVTLEGTGRWVLLALGALFTYGGLSGALHRMELTLDLARRRYTWRQGRVGALESGEGGFEDIEAIVLVKELERKGSDRVEEWEVELVIRGWPRPVEVLETKDEQAAREEARRLAGRLDAELRERTST